MTKNQDCLLKIVPLLKEIVWELCRRFFSSVFSFWLKGYHFTDYVSGIRLPDFSKLAIHRKNDNDVRIYWHDVIVKFFWRFFVLLSIRKLKIHPFEFYPISGDWDRSEIPNLAQMLLMKRFKAVCTFFHGLLIFLLE